MREVSPVFPKHYRELFLIEYYSLKIDMKKIYYKVIFLPFLIILIQVTPVIGSDWVEYARDKDGSVLLYDKVSVNHTKKNRVQVSWKYVYSDESREKLIQDLRKTGLSTEEWNKLSHNLSLQEIDCKKKRVRLFSLTKYDTDGKIIFVHSYDKPLWDYIEPNTMPDKLRKKVCK
jgi:hypothetical protein